MPKNANCPFNRFTSGVKNFFHNPKPYLKRFFFSFIWLAILMFVIDIVTKQIVKNNMAVDESFTLIPNFLFINYIRNPGMAFGLQIEEGITNTIFFIAISVIGTGIIAYIMARYWKKLTGVSRSALMLMISGTIGNLIDRAFYVDEAGGHYVVDWIGFGKFARFNIADSCLTIGALMLVVYLLVVEFIEDSKKRKLAKISDSEGIVKEEHFRDESQIVDVEVEQINKEQNEKELNPTKKDKKSPSSKDDKTSNE